MAKVFVLNNYSFERVWREIKDQLKPNHHLYGTNYIAEKYEVEIVPFDESKSHRLTRFSKFWKKSKIPIPIGDLYQQLYTLKRLQKGDLIYAPCQTQTQLLSYLRAFGFIKNDITVVAHHPPIRGSVRKVREWFFKLELKGTVAYPSLSQRIANKINTYKLDKSKGLHWGPDMGFYNSFVTDHVGNYFLAAGRTGRDFATFAAACSATEAEAKIICLRNDYEKHLKQYDDNPNIDIIANRAEQSYMYDQLTPIMANARAICIPLFEAKSHLAGLTSLTDALGLGKPVLMTRNNFIDIDIERENIGFWIEPGSQSSWEKAIQKLKTDDALCATMGNNAKRLGATQWNAEIFADEILDLMKTI